MLLHHPIVIEVLAEMDRAAMLHGPMPGDIIHAGAIVSEEAGELAKAVNNHVHHGASIRRCRAEALHTAATAMRFVEALDEGRLG